MFIQRQLSTPVQIFSGKFRLTVAVRCPQATLVTRAVELWEGVGGADVRYVLYLTQSLAACRRCPTVPLSRCPNKRAGICFRKFPKNNLVSALSFFRQLHNVCTAQARYCVILAHTSDRYTGIRYATIIRLSIWLQRAWRQSNIHNFIYVLWRCGLYADDVVDVDVATADEL